MHHKNCPSQSEIRLHPKQIFWILVYILVEVYSDWDHASVITRKHSSNMCTARLLTVGGLRCVQVGCVWGCAPPWTQRHTPPQWTDKHLWNLTLPQTSFAGGSQPSFQHQCCLIFHGFIPSLMLCKTTEIGYVFQTNLSIFSHANTQTRAYEFISIHSQFNAM